ncbi:glycoside hydrolase [Teratosphaeria nubilosa]|uniref:Glycoside hydrolase n=1 Tax=Teratosphaeria nubilosa TaxID=161662 RepID=A0A6G1L9Q1_9PEZI|nr:glycoside hydrolase [Teratosphaeria nubilosa]
MTSAYVDSDATSDNPILLQGFEWHTPSQPPAPNESHSRNSHFARLTRLLPSLASAGITSIWLPPGCKANNPQGNGYDCYDLWDLGEFDQKWTRSTKWGSREELNDLLCAAKSLGVECIWDAVLNHKTAGDATDEAWAVEVDPEDRRIEICAPKKIEAWLNYEFPGRERQGMKYSKLKWRAEHFNGTDWDQRAQKNAIYKLIDDPATYPKPHQQGVSAQANGGMNRLARLAGKLKGGLLGEVQRRPGKGWADDVDDLHGNYDYLLFSNIDYKHPAVRDDVLKWSQWMVNDVGIDGFRLDAVQHFSSAFTREWIARVQAATERIRGTPAFIVGEVWTDEVRRIIRWLDAVAQPSGNPVYAFDSCLLYSFSRISEDLRRGSKNADLRTITRDSLLEIRPQSAVTFVSNHDTQPGQTSYTPLNPRHKVLFYTFILLRQQGIPCVFWGDIYGTRGPKAEPPACTVSDGRGGRRSLLPDLMLARRLFAYGLQTDYFDSLSCIGWTRAGVPQKAGSGCAVIISMGAEVNARGQVNWTIKKMQIGEPGEVWVDVLGNEGERAEVVIDERGEGMFTCTGMSVGLFVKKDCAEVAKFPVHFGLDAYGSG